MEDNTLRITVIGGDNRQKLLHEHLINQGYNSNQEAYNGSCNYKNILKSDVIILPTVATKDGFTLNAPECDEIVELDNLLDSTKTCKHIVCGNLPQKYQKKICDNGTQLFQYTDNEIFKTLNAVPTAEGAIAIAIRETDKTICGSKCLIIGNGCIGKALTNILKGMGAVVTVSARKELDFSLLWADGTEYINTNTLNEQELSKFDIIFNTVPKRIISHKKISELTKEHLIIDLASIPYGFDHERKNELNCNLMLSSSLPAIYAPKTSAKATQKVIENYLKEVVKNG